METTTVNVRVDKDVKQAADAVAQSLGMNLSTAINIFLRQMVNHDGLPFEVRNPRPNAETLAAIQEANDIIAGRVQAKKYDSVDAMFNDILSEKDDDDES